jgi:alanine dehydrogenase
MPGAMPVTSTIALTNVTLPYVLKIADQGLEEAARKDSSIMTGINIIDGKITYRAVAEAFDMEYTPVETFL